MNAEEKAGGYMGNLKTKLRRFSVVWFFLLIALGGCLLGSLLYFTLPNPPFRSWRFLAEPPSKAIKLLPPRDYSNVFVQSINGNIYSCKYGNKCELVEKLPEASLLRYSAASNSITPLRPGRVIDSLGYRSWGIDSYEDVYLIILEDGTIWRWSNNPDLLRRDMPNLFAYSLSGILLAAIVGFIVHRTMRPKLK